MTPFIRSVPIHSGDRLAARAVFLVLFGVYLLTFSGLPDVPDAEIEFQTVSSLGRTGWTALGGTPESETIVKSPLAPQIVRVTEDGEHHAFYGVGQALVALPLYAAGRVLSALWPEIERRHAEDDYYGGRRSEYFPHLLVGLRNPLLTALTAWTIVLTVRRLEGERESAVLAGLSYGLATYAWPQACSTLSDVQATFFLFLAFHLLVVLREEYERWRPPPLRLFLGCGAALGLALLTRVATAPALVVLTLAALAVCVRGRRWLSRGDPYLRGALADFALLLAPAALACGAFLWLNAARFGDPLDLGYPAGFVDRGFFNYSPFIALSGILVSPGKGLLWMAPGILLLPWGVSRANDHAERLWPWTLAGMGAAVVVPVVGMLWSGGWTYGPRYVLPLLPFAWVGVGLALDRVRRRIPRRLALATVFAGLLTSVPGVLVSHMTHQELAMQAARSQWPNERNVPHLDWEMGLFNNTQWAWRYAAPWAHWRILRHRLAGLGESFPASEIYFFDEQDDVLLRPEDPRHEGFRHLAWVDLRQRLGGRVWPGVLAALLMIALGIGSAARGLDPSLR